MKHAAPLTAIVAVFVVAACFVHPLRDVPIIDDWTYAYSVEHLLNTGELRIAEISSVYPVAQILWGALFARLFGFSFGVLRLSTVTLAIGGCIALYFTLRELRCSARWSTLGALSLALYPVYFSLSFSYMTDVPAAALSLIAMLFSVRAVQRDRPRLLWLAVAFALAAFLVRATAVVVLPAVVLAVPWRRSGLRCWLVPVAAGFVAAGVAWVVMHRAFGSLEVEAGRLEQLRWLLLVSPRGYANLNLGMLWHMGLAFAPPLLAAAAARRAWRPVAVAAIAMALLSWAVFGRLPTPLPDWNTWSLQDLAGGRVLIGGAAPTSAWSARALPFVIAIALVCVAALVVALGSMIATAVRRRAAAADVDRSGVAPRAYHVLLANVLLAVAVVNALWLFNDRYYLILVPTLAGAAAWWASRAGAQPWIASVLLVPLFLICVTGTRDMLDVNEVGTAAVRDLEASGVPRWQIDGGWALNGWGLWAHPEHLAPGTDRRYGVPFVTSKAETPYKLASAPEAGYIVVRELPLPHVTWQATDRIYVLRQQQQSVHP